MSLLAPGQCIDTLYLSSEVLRRLSCYFCVLGSPAFGHPVGSGRYTITRRDFKRILLRRTRGEIRAFDAFLKSNEVLARRRHRGGRSYTPLG